MKGFGGAWSELKLGCVEEYATRYLQVMQNQSWATLHYVDAFAGRGQQKLKSLTGEDLEEAEAFLEGSALRALKASRTAVKPFDLFLFIDLSSKSCRQLEATVKSQFPDLWDLVDCKQGDANAALSEYVSSTDWATTRSLVFLDPFGLEVRWSTLEQLAGAPGCDVWYLFPLGGVIRMMTNSGVIEESWRNRLTSLFGTEDWYDEFYPSAQTSLLGPDRALKDASTAHILRYISSRLGTIFPAVSRPAVLRNSSGFPMFALVLGVSNPRKPAQDAALRIGNHLVKRLSAQ